MADNQGFSMGDIPLLLYDESFRSRLVKNTSRRAREYWELEFNTLSPSSRNKIITPLTNRISSLLDNPMLENIVAQKTTSIDFRASIDNREIILIKLPVQEYSGIAPIIGTILIAEIYRSTFSFRDTQLEKRGGFSLFVDEFQNFSTRDFSELFTMGRKFGLRMTVGHQTRDQLTDDNKNSTLTAGTIVSFNVTHSNARELSTSFVDQSANIREPIIYPDVLKHLPEHQSSHVADFLHSYIEPLQKRAKEPCIGFPSYLPQFQTIGEVLRYLEELMYRVQVQGYIYEKAGDELIRNVASDMYFTYLSIASRMLGCANFLLDMKKIHPRRGELQAKAQEKIAKLEEEMAKRRAVVESNGAFSTFFTYVEALKKWHEEDAG
ncbi:MAG TPA: hypothetical protein VEP90_08950, partial [Methylomirabilota bacterium]|nr:hypothetical protein [Methylomirabilota bacterium]